MKSKFLNILLSLMLTFAIVFASFQVNAANGVQVGDTNGDGTINLLDVIRLAQYVAGWDVELGGTNTATSSSISSNAISSAESESTSSSYKGFSESAEAGGSMYANAPKKEVHVLMWREYHKSEQQLITQYEKLTGVKVKTTVSDQNNYMWPRPSLRTLRA